MLERRRIVDLARTGKGQTLVTLVRAEGSSYRRPGARILLSSSGDYAGTISGGCLESEVTRKASWLTRDGAAVERYSTLFDDTADIPYGLGCGGTVDLLFEPAATPEARALFSALEASLAGTESTVHTMLPGRGHPLRRAIFSPTGHLLFQSETLTPDDLAALARPEEPQSRIYRERLAAPQRLVVLGASDDAKPVVNLAALLGWTVHVADGRKQLARPDRFPQADAVLTLSNSRTCALDLGLTPQDAVVLMTHSYEQDRDALASLLAAPSQRYLGILGARHRTALLVTEAAALTGLSVQSCCDRIYAPIGLDLGGDGPEAIALAILAEIQACLHGKRRASRRLDEAEVRLQLARNPANHYHPAVCPSAFQESVR